MALSEIPELELPPAKRGDICLAWVTPKDAERRYVLARVLKTNQHGFITHVDLGGELPEPDDQANALRRLSVRKTWSIRGRRGRLVARRCRFPCEWDDFETARDQLVEWWGRA